MPLRALLPAAFAIATLPAIVAAQPGPLAHDPDAREIASYRLTIPAMNKVLRVTHAMVEELKKDPRVQERIRIETELRALERKEELTGEDGTRMEELQTRRDQLEDMQPATLTQASTLTEMEAAITSYPPLSGPLAKVGMTPREYAKFFLALIHASLAASLQTAGMLKDLPPDVNRDNVQFVREHEKELHQIQQAFQSLGGELAPQPAGRR